MHELAFAPHAFLISNRPLDDTIPSITTAITKTLGKSEMPNYYIEFDEQLRSEAARHKLSKHAFQERV